MIFFVIPHQISTGTFATVDMIPDNPGIWALVCKTNHHYHAGMQAKYDVRDDCQKGKDIKMDGTVRKYFIAAVEREWDYAPSGQEQLEGVALEKSE